MHPLSQHSSQFSSQSDQSQSMNQALSNSLMSNPQPMDLDLAEPMEIDSLQNSVAPASQSSSSSSSAGAEQKVFQDLQGMVAKLGTFAKLLLPFQERGEKFLSNFIQEELSPYLDQQTCCSLRRTGKLFQAKYGYQIDADSIDKIKAILRRNVANADEDVNKLTITELMGRFISLAPSAFGRARLIVVDDEDMLKSLGDLSKLCQPRKITISTLPKSVCVTEELLCAALDGSCKVETLSIYKCAKLGVRTFQMLSSLPNLTTLELYGELPVSQDTMEAISTCRRLKTLALHKVTKKQAIQSIIALSRLPLTELSLTNQSVAAEELAPLAYMKSLQYLSLANTNCNDDSVLLLSSLPQLQRLSLAMCKRITGINFELLPKSLQALDLSGCSGLEKHAYEALAMLPQLRKVTLNNMPQLVDEELACLWGCESLSILRIGTTPALTLKGFAALEGHKNLSNLTLPPGISDEVLALLPSLPQLSILTVNISNVTNIGLGHLARCLNIKRLGITNDFKVNRKGPIDIGQGVVAIAQSNALVHLTLYNTRITLANFVALAPHLQNMRQINFWYESMSIHKMQILANNCPNLHFVGFSSTGISEAGLKMLARSPSIRDITFNNCTLVAKEVIKGIFSSKVSLKFGSAYTAKSPAGLTPSASKIATSSTASSSSSQDAVEDNGAVVKGRKKLKVKQSSKRSISLTIGNFLIARFFLESLMPILDIKSCLSLKLACRHLNPRLKYFFPLDSVRISLARKAVLNLQPKSYRFSRQRSIENQKELAQATDIEMARKLFALKEHFKTGSSLIIDSLEMLDVFSTFMEVSKPSVLSFDTTKFKPAQKNDLQQKEQHYQEEILKGLEAHPNIESINLINLELPKKLICEALQKSLNLRNMIINDVDDELLGPISKCQSIVDLVIGGLKATSNGLLALATMPNLKFLSVHSRTMSQDDLESLLLLRNLSQFTIFADIKDSFVGKLAALEKLSTICLSSTRLTGKNFEMLPKNLDRIILSNCTALDRQAFTALRHMPNLKYLFLAGLVQLSNFDLEEIAQSTSLRYCVVKGSPFIGAEYMKVLKAHPTIKFIFK